MCGPSGYMDDGNGFRHDIHAHISPTCVPGRYDIYMKNGGHICFWLNTVYNFTNGLVLTLQT